MTTLLLNTSLLVPILLTMNKCFTKRGVSVNIFGLFSAGYIYYCIIPLYINYNQYYSSYSININPLFLAIDPSDLIYVLIMMNLFYLSFFFGYSINKVEMRSQKFHTKLYEIIFYLYLLLYILWMIINLTTLKFGSYMTIPIYHQAWIISLTVLSLMLHHSKCIDLHVSLYKYFSNKYFVLVILTNFPLLIMGNRTWFVLTIISYLYMYGIKYKFISYKSLILLAVFFIVFIGSYPFIRTGFNHPISIAGNIVHFVDQIFYMIFFDGMANSVSFNYYYSNNTVNLFGHPTIFLSRLFDILPSKIFPIKYELFLSPDEYGIYEFSPFGARHLLYKLLIYFGIIGTSIYFFLLPVILKRCLNNPYLRGSTVVIVACIALPMWRDFDGFIVKLFIQFAIIWPLLIECMYALPFLLLRIINKKHHKKLFS